MPRLSPAGSATVIAGPAKAGPTRSRTPLANPRRPSASCTVATPKEIRALAISAWIAEDSVFLHQLQRGFDMRSHEARRHRDIARANGGGDFAVLPLDLALL